MLTLEQALWHGEKVGVRYYVKDRKSNILGGTKTLEQAEEMVRRFYRQYKWVSHIEKRSK